MPQVQVLPYVPSFGEKLASAFGQTAGNVGEAYFRGRGKQEAESSLQQRLNPRPTTPMQSFEQAGQSTPVEGTSIEKFQSAGESGKPRRSATDLLDIHRLASSARGPKEADKLFDILLKQEELTEKEDQKIREQDRDLEKTLAKEELQPFFAKIAKDRENLPHAIQANDQIIDAIKSGNVGPGSLAHIGAIASDLGVPKSITNLLESTDSKQFNNGLKNLMGHTIKDTFRGTTTKTEIDLAKAMQEEVGVSERGNLAASYAFKSDLIIRQKELDIYDELVDRGVPRSKIPAMVEKQLKPFREETKDNYFAFIKYLREEGPK